MYRLTFLLFVSFAASATCPSNEYIGSYPIDTPSEFCASYLSESCTASCITNGVCVSGATQKGPYYLTGASCSSGGGGTVDCTLTPTDPACTNTGGTVDCAKTPSDPSCWPDPSAPLTPDSPECKYLPISLYPKCQDTSSGNPADGIGSYMDSNGKWRELRINTGLKDTIITSAKGVQDEVSKLSQKFGNEVSTSNNLLNEINNNIIASKDQTFNLTNSSIDHLSNIERILNNPLSNSSSSASSAIDYSNKLSGITDILNNMYYYASQMNSSLYSMRWDTNNLNGMQGSMYNIEDWLSKISDKLASGASGAGSTGGSGGSTGDGDAVPVGPQVPDEPDEGKGRSFWKTQYPGGLQTLFSNKMDEVKATALAGLLNNFQMPGLGDGSFPTVTFDFNFGAYANFGVYRFNDYLPDLSVIISLLKFMVIFWALIGARSDIFGG